MEQSKLAHSWILSAVAWVLTVLSWCASHIGIICGIFALIASYCSIQASRSTKRYWDKKTEQLGSKTKADPDTET